ncbi:MAG: elongation factor P-like protein YeiP [Gammaproteobacteria bacterium]|nr:MAG: elongation factor P-like protein YeiP [Gammaproteobacteria bacterium]
MKASELKNGTVFDAGGRTVIVTGVQMQTASSRSGNTLYKVRGRDLITRQKFEASFKGDETLAAVACERRAVQLLYRDADGCTFMDGETFEQHTLDNESLEEQLPYLVDGLDGLYALVIDGRLLALQLPTTIELDIVDASPAMKGASQSARSKPATLATGLIVQVPEYLAVGVRVRVNTETGNYVGRA